MFWSQTVSSFILFAINILRFSLEFSQNLMTSVISQLCQQLSMMDHLFNVSMIGVAIEMDIAVSMLRVVVIWRLLKRCDLLTGLCWKSHKKWMGNSGQDSTRDCNLSNFIFGCYCINKNNQYFVCCPMKQYIQTQIYKYINI